MCVASTSSALTGAVGLLGARNGSTSTRALPSESSKVAWPRKRISMVETSVIWEREGSSLVVAWGWPQFAGQLPANRHADQHPHPGLLGQQRAEGRQPLLRVLERGHA